jgi:hypothetical protein
VRFASAALRLGIVATLAAVLAPACSLGQGSGSAVGTLNVPDCWSGPFDLHPDFFAAVPGASPHYPTTANDALQIRIQNGDFYETFTDGILILVDDAGQVRGDPAQDGTPRPSLLGQTLVVSLPAGVVPPGVPITALPNPPIVHATLYLDRTCRTQNDALYAMSAVSGVDPISHECYRPESGQSSLTCPGPATADGGTAEGGALDAGPAGGDAGSSGVGDASVGGGAIGTSTITFTSLFDGNPDESDASQRLSEATFDLYFADPREVCSGGLGPPPPCRGHLAGNFKFYFERGRPAQPFP